MRAKSRAQRMLEQVEMADTIVKNKLVEKQQWMDIALGITANMGGERVQSSGTQSKMADALNKCLDMEKEIDEAVDRLVSAKRDVIATIEKLDSPFEYRVLHYKYIQYKTLEEIAELMDKSYTSITTAHGRALVAVERLLEERTRKKCL